jgi:hypothetical protein
VEDEQRYRDGSTAGVASTHRSATMRAQSGPTSDRDALVVGVYAAGLGLGRLDLLNQGAQLGGEVRVLLGGIFEGQLDPGSPTLNKAHGAMIVKSPWTDVHKLSTASKCCCPKPPHGLTMPRSPPWSCCGRAGRG